MPITSSELQKILPVVEILVRKMGVYAHSQWGKTDSRQKGERGDLVTDSDLFIEQRLREELPKILDFPIVGEEEGGTLSNETSWVIDPIDGTKHFAHKMPSFFVQLALVENKQPLLGVLFDPITNQLFSAVKDSGTTLNGEKITPQPLVSLENSIVDIDFGGADSDLKWRMDNVSRLAEKVYRVRITGGRFSPYLLTGGINAYVVINPTTKIWDQLPKLILYREAGYETLEFVRNDNTYRIIAGQELAKAIDDLINY